MALASVVILKIISNFLTVGGYGTYSAIYEFLAFFGIAADLGLFTIAVREMGKGERTREFIAGNIMGMRIVLSVIAMSVAIAVAFALPQYSGTYIPMGVAIGSFTVFLSIMHGTVSSVLQVEHKMQWSTVGLVLGKMVSLGWMIAVAFFFYKGNASEEAFYQLIWAGVYGNLAAFIFTFYFSLKVAKIRPLYSKEYWKEIMFTAAPYGLALVLNMIYFRIGSLMLLFMKGPEEVGLFSLPMRVLEILNVIPVYFMNSVLPVMTRAIHNKSGRVGRMMQLSFDFLFMSAVPIVSGLFVLAYQTIFLISSPEFLSRLDDGYYGSDIAMKILVFAMFFSYMNSLFTYSLVAAGKQNSLLAINGSAAVFNIVMNFILIPEFGFRGAAVNTALTEIFILFFAYHKIKKSISFKLNFGGAAKVVLANLVMILSVLLLEGPTYDLWGLQNLNVFLLVFVGACFYGLTLLLLKAVPEEFLGKFARLK